MKYIAFISKGGMRVARVFSDLETHLDVAAESGIEPVSAGFVGMDANGKPFAYGESLSLNIKSDKCDTPILRLMWHNMKKV